MAILNATLPKVNSKTVHALETIGFILLSKSSFADALTIGATLTIGSTQKVVLSIRDLVSEPLTVEEFESQPFQARSRYLVTLVGQDGRLSKIHVSTSREFEIRPALYQIGGRRPIQLIGRKFQSSKQDLELLLEHIEKLKAMDFNGLELRLMVDGLRLFQA